MKPGKYVVATPGMFYIKGLPYVLGSEVTLAPGETLDPVLAHLDETGGLTEAPPPVVALVDLQEPIPVEEPAAAPVEPGTDGWKSKSSRNK